MDVADVNGQTPLHALCSQPGSYDEQPKACRLLLHHGAKMDQQDAVKMTPLAYAALNNNVMLITELIKGNADVNLVDIFGQSPLMH